MTQSLFDHLPKLAPSIAAARHLVLFFDFDGTLAPIVSDPSQAYMPAETRKSLTTLAGTEKLSLAIISGRALGDLRERVGMRKVIYAGNHGLEISGPGLQFVEPTSAQRIKALGELSRHLRTRLRHVAGVEVENKVLSASVHFRRVADSDHQLVQDHVLTAVGALGKLFDVSVGNKVCEIRPHVNWNKGMAIRWIKETSKLTDALAIYIGDDVTDEAAFSAIPDGISIRVGRSAHTLAKYHLPKQEAVQRFLAWLVDLHLEKAGRAHTPE